MRERRKKLNPYAYSNEIDYEQYSIVLELEKIEKIEQGLIASAARANRTIKNRSAETIAKQAKAVAEKEKTDARIAELRQTLDGKLSGELFAAVLASLQDAGIQATLEKFRNELAELKKDSDEFDQLSNGTRPRELSYYDYFLFDLARQYPPLIVYLPANCFIHGVRHFGGLPMSKLNKAQLDALQPRLEKEGVFGEPIFKKFYIKFFPAHIKEISDVNDIAYALKIDPTCFNKLEPDSGLRNSFWQNVYILDKCVKSAPAILAYLTPKELKYYADKCPSGVGLAIKACPNVLESLPKDFFGKHSPKYIFANQRKHELKPLLEPYFEKFPVLAAYFDSKLIRPTGPRPKQPPYTFSADF